jgi:glutaredoxin-like YruB-family protein
MAQVTVYSTPTCPYCKMAKAFLDEKGIAYTDHDVSADTAAAEAMVKKSGQMGVPVLEVDGKIIVGFDQNELSEALGL